MERERDHTSPKPSKPTKPRTQEAAHPAAPAIPPPPYKDFSFNLIGLKPSENQVKACGKVDITER